MFGACSFRRNRLPLRRTMPSIFTFWSLFRAHGRRRDRRGFDVTQRYILLRIALLAATAASLAACAAPDRAPTVSQPTFYQNLAQPGAALDAQAAEAMISNYRANNGLTTLALDPMLMKMAQDQAQAMAARNKMDHDVARPFKARMASSGF